MESLYESGLDQPMHRHERAGITLVLKGGVRERSGACELECLPGDVLRKPAGTSHSDRFSPAVTRTVRIDFADLETGPEGWEPLGRLGYGVDHRPEVRSAMFAVWHATYDETNRVDLDGMIANLRATLDQQDDEGARASTRKVPPGWLRDIRESIWDRSSQPIRVRELADQAGVHPVYLARVFRRHFGVSVVDYMTIVRLTKSIELMAGSSKQLGKVALECGFADQAHWCRRFRSRMTCSPRSFRTLLHKSLCYNT